MRNQKLISFNSPFYLFKKKSLASHAPREAEGDSGIYNSLESSPQVVEKWAIAKKDKKFPSLS